MHKRLASSALLAIAALHAQTGPRIVTVISTVDGSEQPYALYIPRSFDAPKEYGLLISLHSEDSNHRLNLAQVLGVIGRGAIASQGMPSPGMPSPRVARDGTDRDGRVPAGAGRPTLARGGVAAESSAFPALPDFPALRDRDIIVACPLARGTMGYQGIAEQDVYDVLADVERRYPVDPDRVYLTGISMGGGGALWLAASRPDLWAGVAAMCPDNMPGSEELAANLLNVPVRLYHGELDTIVPVASSRAWQRRLLDAGVPAAYTEYPATRHNVWDTAYSKAGVLEWLTGLRRNRWPERVRLVARSYQYSSAYWVRIDALTPGVPAQIDARRASNGDMQVIAANVDGFTLTAPATEPALVTIDGTVLRVKRGTALSFTKAATGWRQGPIAPAGKCLGAEGPIVRALSGRHIYVYGTLGAQTDEELAERRKVAEAASQWSTVRSHLQLSLPVKSDRQVTAEDIDSADLVLFGTAESNALVARFANRLPIELRPDAADYGLLFVAPVGKHYALVNSGLPWWTGADESAVAGYPWEPAKYRELTGLGDYVLFRGNVTQVVAEGRFDANWKVPADAAARLTAAGTVRIH